MEKEGVVTRQVMTGIFYVLRTSVAGWKAMPRELWMRAAYPCRAFQEWVEQGIFRKLWRAALLYYDTIHGIDWAWQSLDAVMTKAPLGGEKNWEKPD